jgi:hypothetical protein
MRSFLAQFLLSWILLVVLHFRRSGKLMTRAT